ncbi:MAG: hypothetical protein ACJAVR_001322 [Paracoccaceae bacterium]|jgi:hypothetical protein
MPSLGAGSRLHLADQGCMHAAVFGLPFIENSRSLSAFAVQKPTGQRHHAMFAPKLSHKHAALSRAQDDHGLGFGAAAFVQLESPRLGRRESSTYEPRQPWEGLPFHFI